MPQRTALPALAGLMAFAIAPAAAQGLTSIAGGIPGLSSISAGNAAGVLGYCVKNKVLSGGSATNALSGLMKKPGITSGSGYSAGQAGNILTGNGQKFSLNQVPSQVKSQACNAVLKQAPKFL